MRILVLETSCDETAAAVVTDRLDILSSVVASQDRLHERYGGVVPEIASRAHVERILPVIDEAVRKADLSLAALDAVAVTVTPGLAGSLLVGLSAAKALCAALDLPLIGVDHLQAHVYACRVASGKEVFPCVGMIISGGHSNLYRCQTPLEFELLGATIDDAAGEAFDKVAAMLRLPYPGGPSIQRAAENGNPKALRFPRAFINDQSRLQFSFSGLKTAVRYALVGPGQSDFSRIDLPEGRRSDIAASFQEAVVDCLVAKADLALSKTGLSTLCVGGGVAANRRFRDRVEEMARRRGATLHIAPLHLCTDNAVMGAIAVERFKAGRFEPLDIDVLPGLVRMKGDSR